MPVISTLVEEIDDLVMERPEKAINRSRFVDDAIRRRLEELRRTA